MEVGVTLGDGVNGLKIAIGMLHVQKRIAIVRHPITIFPLRPCLLNVLENHV